MAALVAAAQAAQAAATEAQEKATLASQGQLPPATPPVVTTTAAAPAPTVPAKPAGSTTTPSTAGATAAPPSTAASPTTAPATTASPTTAPATTSPPTTTGGTAPIPPVNQSRAAIAIAYARAQLGAPYLWGGAGPKSVGFDCSGLVMMAYAAAGVQFPHLAQDQYDLTTRVPISQLQPGDLVFYGTPSDVYHVGLYIGGGDMIDAPETGQYVSIQNIYWSDLLSGGRVG
jgi:cell wall-associated NlpC family hydrolase